MSATPACLADDYVSWVIRRHGVIRLVVRPHPILGMQVHLHLASGDLLVLDRETVNAALLAFDGHDEGPCPACTDSGRACLTCGREER